MSLVEDLGAHIRATADQLPVELLQHAVERLHRATETLQWVRHAGLNPMGVPQLGAATEHVEHAAYAVRVARESLSAYAMTALGLRAPIAPVAGGRRRRAAAIDESTPDEAREPEAAALPAGWWPSRVDELTGYSAEPQPPDRRDNGAATADRLLRRVCGHVRGGDRSGLRDELRRADPSVGLHLSGLAGPVAHRLAGRLLGRDPRPDDLARLRRETGTEVRGLLPNLPEATLDTLLARACRASAPAAEKPHPVDSAVASAVLAGVLLRRTGADLDPAETTAGGSRSSERSEPGSRPPKSATAHA